MRTGIHFVRRAVSLVLALSAPLVAIACRDASGASLPTAQARKPKLRYTSGGLAARLRLLRTFAPAALMDAGLRSDLRLETR